MGEMAWNCEAEKEMCTDDDGNDDGGNLNGMGESVSAVTDVNMYDRHGVLETGFKTGIFQPAARNPGDTPLQRARCPPSEFGRLLWSKFRLPRTAHARY